MARSVPGRPGGPPPGAAGPVRIDRDSCQRSMMAAGSSAIFGSFSSSQETERGRSLSSATTAPASMTGAMVLAKSAAAAAPTASPSMPALDVDVRLSPTLIFPSPRTSRKAVQAAGS
jgi:hypothetical protein